MRLFLAIELPDDVRSHLLVARERLEAGLPKIAYTKPANLHLTLKFLGETDAKKLAALNESLARIRSRPIELHAGGIDCFPAKGPIRIVTAAMGGSTGPLRALVEAVEQRCKFLGYDRAQRAHKPHVTLGRARPVLSAKFRQLAADATLGLWPGPRFEAGEFMLMDSQLGADGSVYSVLTRFGLEAEPG